MWVRIAVALLLLPVGCSEKLKPSPLQNVPDGGIGGSASAPVPSANMPPDGLIDAGAGAGGGGGAFGAGGSEPGIVTPDGADAGDGGPGSVAPLGFSSISAGFNYACGVTTEDTVVCWGAGQDEDGQTNTFVPVQVPALANVRSVVAGPLQVCAVLGDDSASCWSLQEPAAPTPVTALVDLRALVPGTDNTCGLLQSGAVSCYPNGGATAVSTGLSDIRALDGTLGIGSHFCALDGAGKLSCWGDNSRGQLGTPSSSAASSEVPLEVEGLVPVQQVATGILHTCALSLNGQVLCWGDNTNGQIGSAISTVEAEPTQVPGLPPALALDAGGAYTCAVSDEHELWCWGLLGDNPRTPQRIQGLSNVVAVSAGFNAACAVFDDASAACFGNNGVGQLGNPVAVDILGFGAEFYAPVPVLWPR